MALAHQASALPTNKLMVSALIAPAFTEFWGTFMSENFPALGGEAVTILVGALSALVVGYFVPDRANVPL